MKSFLKIIIIIYMVSVSTFAQDMLPQPLDMPKIVVPAEAVKSGLGGKVSVRISVNKEGKVTKADNMLGPDWVCSSVKRADVVALRDAAREIALQTTFTPGMKNGKPVSATVSMNFDFPRMTGVEESLKESEKTKFKDYLIANGLGVEILDRDILTGKAIKMPKPAYPANARAARAEGAVTIEVIIDENGDIFSAKPKEGHRLLLPPAIQAACSSKFSPTSIKGRPVNVSGDIRYAFFAPR